MYHSCPLIVCAFCYLFKKKSVEGNLCDDGEGRALNESLVLSPDRSRAEDPGQLLGEEKLIEQGYACTRTCWRNMRSPGESLWMNS